MKNEKNKSNDVFENQEPEPITYMQFKCVDISGELYAVVDKSRFKIIEFENNILISQI